MSILTHFDPLDSPMEEQISTTRPTDLEENLILTHRICIWKSKPLQEALQILNKLRHPTAEIFAFITMFYSVVYPSNVLFGVGHG